MACTSGAPCSELKTKLTPETLRQPIWCASWHARLAGASRKLCLRLYDSSVSAAARLLPRGATEKWLQLLREDRAQAMANPEIPIEAFYEDTGMIVLESSILIGTSIRM